MEPSDLALLRDLLTQSRVLSLALVDGARPIAGVSPFLAAPDLTALVVHGSRLSRHVRALSPGLPFSAAIHAPDRAELDPLRLPRVLIDGVIGALGDAEREEVLPRWVERFPSAAMTVELGDFAFHRLSIRSGRLVAGFGRAFGFGTEALAAAAALES